MPCWEEDVLVVAVARPLVAWSWVHPTPRLKRHSVKAYGGIEVPLSDEERKLK